LPRLQGTGIVAAIMNLPLLKQLSEAPGVPGREERVRDILQNEFKDLFDETAVDPLGSLIGRNRAAAGGGFALITTH
jgi:endoglucanase